jgi:hypothetical protein
MERPFQGHLHPLVERIENKSNRRPDKTASELEAIALTKELTTVASL